MSPDKHPDLISKADDTLPVLTAHHISLELNFSQDALEVHVGQEGRTGIVAFLRGIPIFVFLTVLLIHLALGAWFLTARFDLFSPPSDQPIFVSLEASPESADEGQLNSAVTEPTTRLPNQPQQSQQESSSSQAQARTQDRASRTEPSEVQTASSKSVVDISLQQQQAAPAPQKPATRPQPPQQRESSSPSQLPASGAKGTPATSATSAASSTQATGITASSAGPRVVSRIDYLGAPPSPVYPARAKSRKQEGRVVVRVLVESSGSVKSLSLLKTSGFDLLDQAALEAVGRTRFKPYLENGIPYDRLADIPIDFVLNH